jgi:hypothetical protein
MSIKYMIVYVVMADHSITVAMVYLSVTFVLASIYSYSYSCELYIICLMNSY